MKDLGRIVQKISKYGEIKFSIIQPKKVKTKPEDNVDNKIQENVDASEKN